MEREPTTDSDLEYEQLALFGLEKILQHRFEIPTVTEIPRELIPSEHDDFIDSQITHLELVSIPENEVEQPRGGPPPSGQEESNCICFGDDSCDSCTKNKEKDSLIGIAA